MGAAKKGEVMHIWLVSIFEQTPVDKVFSTRFLSVADKALERGHRVTFWGSTFKHNTKNQRYPATTVINYKAGYDLVFVKSLAYQSNLSFKRIWSHYKIGTAMTQEFDKHGKPDVILLAFPPISLAYEVTRWARRSGIPVVMDIIDPWPTSFETKVPPWASFLSKPIFYLPRKRLAEALEGVDILTSISYQYLDWANQFHPVKEKHYLYPAADFTAIRQFIENAAPVEDGHDTFNVIYAGSLASSYDIDTILQAAERLLGYEDIHFYMAGTGPQAEKIQSYQERFDNLTYLGRLPKDELMRYYAHSHVGLTQHIKGATQSVTYKLFDLLAAGLPILNSLESEMRDIIVGNQVGLHNPPGDATALQENILQLYKNPDLLLTYKTNGLHLAKEVGDTEVIYKRFVEILETKCH